MDVEVVCYQVEILVPEGLHKYVYSDKIPTEQEVKAEYGLFARIGKSYPLMHVTQHKQVMEDYENWLAEINSCSNS